MATLKIYRSSAGAGKTHTLVSAYLKQALKHPEAFTQILAVTFTNQATQEMKQRILTYLHSLAQGTPSPVAEHLMQSTAWDMEALQARAQAVLSHILHQYTQFSVSTIDSFFQKIIRGFAQELNLQSGFKVEIDQGHVLNRAIDALIRSASQDPQLQQWLVSFAEDKLLSGKHWNFQRELAVLGYEIFAESFGQHEAQLIATTSDHATLRQFVQQLHQSITHFEKQLQDWGKQVLVAMQQAGLTVSDFAYGATGVAGYLAGLATKRRWQPTQRALQALQSVEAWYSKSSDQKDKIIQAVQKDLLPYLQQIVQFYDAHHHVYHTASEVRHFIYAFGIATRLLEKLNDYRATHNIMLVSDASLFLRKIIAENDTPFVYEKIGAFYKHFLIDEFQDISGFQWNNFRPLVANALDEGYDSLVVGDVKQSIYRWRGGDWRLLLTQLQQDVPQTAVVNLDQNWRSRENIISFNNAFFTAAATQVVQHLTAALEPLTDTSLKKDLTAQVQQLRIAYQDVHQQLPPARVQEDKGYINITFLEDTVEESPQSWREVALARIPRLVEQLQQDGFALKDIALLVRSNAEARAIFQTLLAHQQSPQAQPGCRYDVISAESLYLGHNPWVNLLVSAMRCLIHEEDTLAQAELLFLYQVHVRQAPPEAATLTREGLPAAFFDERIQLLQRPLYELVEALIGLFQLNQPAAIPFLQAFQDLVLRFSAKELPTVPQFLAWWQERGFRHTLPRVEEQEAMTLMTVHQAKGLQFKVVIVPFCAWDLDHNLRRPPTLWCTTDLPPFNQFPVLPVRYSGRLQDTVYAQAYYEEQMQAYLDHLNLLYVAFTRPEDRLYVLAQRPPKTALKTIADLLYQTIVQGADESWSHSWDDGAGVLEIGIPVTQDPPPNPPAPADLQQYVTNHWYRQFAQLRVNPWEDITEGWLAEKISYGIKVHRLLAQLKRLEDFPTAWEGMSPTELTKLKQQLTTLLQQPQAKDWFSSAWQVKTEASILTPTGQVLRPDRVLIQGDKVVVLDFKTGNPYSQDPQQVQTYMQLLRDMGYAQVQGYLLYLKAKKIVEVVN
ncbi:MAG: UvrD-helicase domain-containing protein [Bacteroidota bacterium]